VLLQGTFEIRREMNIAVAHRAITVSVEETHVWVASTANLEPATLARLEITLSPTERIHAAKFRFLPDQTRYIFAHGMLREILSRYVGKSPSQLTFVANDFGKPCLENAGAAGRIMFNMSHSEGLVIAAVSLDCCVGVDTEFIRPIEDIDSLVQRVFTASEQTLVQAAPIDLKQRVFYQCWTRKEAFIKAIGKGFSIPLDSFDSTLAPGARGRWLQTSSDSLANKTWWLSDLALLEGYVGALVVEGRVPKITYVTWSPIDASVPGTTVWT
jgi:4'-phosphopantetheinyl transferase